MVIENVHFDLNLGQVVKQPSKVTEKGWNNPLNQEEAKQFEFSHAATETSLFEYGSGFMIGSDTAFKSTCLIKINRAEFLMLFGRCIFLAGLPFIGDGKIETGILRTNKFNTLQDFSKNYTANYTVIVPPQSSSRARATLQHAILTVPYTITLRLKRDFSFKIYTKGIWTGLTTNLDYMYHSPIPINLIASSESALP